ncbi:unnamed protein product [Nyctereutes procyonoides]|uniref:(raccoon dog) hypothetical protein n=1 Tax=Nyctereutes procyonoides TaxID=34880 RepID=A0A811ZE78_NYCPR|nr:unnamed protein product [Nyctereutes procyonoides]
MVTQLVMGSHAQRLCRTARWQVDKEQDWPPTGWELWFLQGFLGTPLCEGGLSSDASAHLSLPRPISYIMSLTIKPLAVTGQDLPGSDLENGAKRYLKRFRNHIQQSQRLGRVGHTNQASMQLGREQRWSNWLQTWTKPYTTSRPCPSSDHGAYCIFRA